MGPQSSDLDDFWWHSDEMFQGIRIRGRIRDPAPPRDPPLGPDSYQCWAPVGARRPPPEEYGGGQTPSISGGIWWGDAATMAVATLVAAPMAAWAAGRPCRAPYASSKPILLSPER